ncbi:NlpC/P60 family protein [Rhodococcus antarcticus]|uniref:NlpC/P60 family protein n=1 Tax=Rhodococcus antarcticus TaxID=2987751 RepID=A0ABY6P089_9NOCA|nr:C40 family peptidase [Rhodococcus antarcticus]UZJ24771.1 NlpC/P60 family protein [Rhodococcus antarcticus]
MRARVLRRCLAVGLVVAGTTLLGTSPAALADPTVPPPSSTSDAEQQLREISHQAEAVNEQVLVAQEDLAAKHGAERAAQDQVTVAGVALDHARATQSEFQGTVDSLTAARYRGARLDSMTALMLSRSPQELLDQMAALDMLAADTTIRVAAYNAAAQQATQAQSDAATAARAASDASAAAQVTTRDLAAKKVDLDREATQVRVTLASLTAAQRVSYFGPTAPAGYVAPAAPTGHVAPAVPAGQVAVAVSGVGALTPAGSGVGGAALQAALSKVGSPYAYGANGPSAFDCSGLVQWSYAQAGMSLPRTTGGQAGVGTAVSQADLQPGDIVIFYNGGHDGLYVGNGMVVHAPTEGDVVKVAPMQYMPFAGARRP